MTNTIKYKVDVFFREKGNVIVTKNELVCRELLLWVLAF